MSVLRVDHGRLVRESSFESGPGLLDAAILANGEVWVTDISGLRRSGRGTRDDRGRPAGGTPHPFFNRSVGDLGDEAAALLALGRATAGRHDFAKAESRCARALALARKLGCADSDARALVEQTRSRQQCARANASSAQ